MLKLGDTLRFSASDLVGHVDCHHLTALGAAAARGELERPRFWIPSSKHYSIAVLHTNTPT